MKKILVLFIVLLSYTGNAQHGYIASEVDYKSIISQQDYNGTIKLGYSARNFQLEGFVDLFPDIDYTSIGLNAYYVISPKTKIRPLVGIQLSTINRGTVENPSNNLFSFGTNAVIEYHFSSWGFLSARWELKYRSDIAEQENTDLPFTSYLRGSGLLGIGFLIF